MLLNIIKSLNLGTATGQQVNCHPYLGTEFFSLFNDKKIEIKKHEDNISEIGVAIGPLRWFAIPGLDLGLK